MGLGFVLFFTTCTSSYSVVQIRKTPDYVLQNCPQLSIFIQTHWKKHKKNKLYSYDDKFLGQLKKEFEPCLQHLNKNQLIDLFGIPSEDLNDGYLNYYLNLKCVDNSLGICRYLTFIYDTANNRMITVTELTTHTMQ